MENYIAKLTSENQSKFTEAVDYFDDLFYWDKSISDENYLLLIKTIVDRIEQNIDIAKETDLLGILSSSLYTNKTENNISPKIFKESLRYIAKTKNKIYYSILKPLSNSNKLKDILDEYLNAMKSLDNV